MPRPRSAASNDGDESNDILLQEEFERLQNQYRILKNDRNAYLTESQDTLRKQREEIEHLKKDNEEIQKNLNQAKSSQNQKHDDKTLTRLQELTKVKDELDECIENEKSSIAKLDSAITKNERMNKSMKKESGGNAEKTSQERSRAIQKRTQTLENRLDKENKRYNDTLTENAKLREDIERMRTEKSMYDDLYRKLAFQLDQCRDEKNYLTELATAAYDQRDECNNKIIALRDKNDKDELQFQTEKRDLQRIIDHDNKLRDFMKAKANDRVDWKKDAEDRRMQHGSQGEKAKEQQKKQIDEHKEAFDRIKEITKEENLEIIVRDFIQKEDDNFALFQYVSEQNNQIESLKEDLDQLNRDMDRFIAEDCALESERERILEEIDRKISLVKTARKSSDAKLIAINKVLEDLRTGIDSVFGKCNCDPKAINEMLGADETISDRNCMLYLGAVEQKTNELLAVQYYRQMKKREEDDDAPPPQHGITLGLGAALKEAKETTIVAPVIGDDFDDDEDPNAELRPMSQTELKEKVLKGIKRTDLGGKPKREKSIHKPAKKA